MELNSFCVIVRKYGVPVEWTRPYNYDRAVEIYTKYVNQYIGNSKREENERFFGIYFLGFYSDEKIKRTIRKFNGDMSLAYSVISDFNTGYEKNEVRVEMMHSSKT